MGDLSSDLFKIYLKIYLAILICICNNESSKQITESYKMNFTKSQLNLIGTYIKLVNDNVRQAYSFASGQAHYDEVGASFTIGKKYLKVIINIGQKSVHAFVDIDLNVYKASSWNIPAKGVRYNLNTDINKLTSILQAKNAYCGGYLYK